jgi:eukaryotic-like serine/threonine-protein kinase
MPLEKLGPYRIEKLLGRGGMGAVYAGIEEATGQRAAVKVLAAHLTDNADFRERFMSEVETLKKLRHPNIVQLFAYGEEGEHLFYVMELVDGKNLQDELQASRRFQWREVARIGVDVCRALKHAHDNGVIHRDLKPANLLVDRFDQVKLTDFGIAKLYGATNITVAGGILGTADYMSPEQAEGKPVTARSDLYSLGSVLYALLTGRPPFASKSIAEVIHGLRFEKPIGVRRLAPDTPAEFESIVMQLLEKDPAKRIPSAFAVGNFLRAMEHALSIETQIGSITVDDLPLGEPSSPGTQVTGGDDLTIVTAAGRSPATVANSGATVDLSAAVSEDDYRIASANLESPAAEEISSGPTTAARSRFVTMAQEEEERRKQRPVDEEAVSRWVVVAGMGLLIVLLGSIVTYALLPPSADTLYARANAAVDSGEFAAAEAAIDAFSTRFPEDSRQAEIQSLRDSLALRRMERQFELRARLGQGGSLTPIEQAYMDAVRLSQTDPARALGRFEAFIDLFEGAQLDGAEEDRLRILTLELARKGLEELREQSEQDAADHRELIESRLSEAERVEESSPEQAAMIRRAVIELYGDKPWAADLINRARTALDSP